MDSVLLISHSSCQSIACNNYPSNLQTKHSIVRLKIRTFLNKVDKVFTAGNLEGLTSETSVSILSFLWCITYIFITKVYTAFNLLLFSPKQSKRHYNTNLYSILEEGNVEYDDNLKEIESCQ